MSKGHFLIGDGIGDPRHAGAGIIFGHREYSFLVGFHRVSIGLVMILRQG